MMALAGAHVDRQSNAPGVNSGDIPALDNKKKVLAPPESPKGAYSQALFAAEVKSTLGQSLLPTASTSYQVHEIEPILRETGAVAPFEAPRFSVSPVSAPRRTLMKPTPFSFYSSTDTGSPGTQHLHPQKKHRARIPEREHLAQDGEGESSDKKVEQATTPSHMSFFHRTGAHLANKTYRRPRTPTISAKSQREQIFSRLACLLDAFQWSKHLAVFGANIESFWPLISGERNDSVTTRKFSAPRGIARMRHEVLGIPDPSTGVTNVTVQPLSGQSLNIDKIKALTQIAFDEIKLGAWVAAPVQMFYQWLVQYQDTLIQLLDSPTMNVNELGIDLDKIITKVLPTIDIGMSIAKVEAYLESLQPVEPTATGGPLQTKLT